MRLPEYPAYINSAVEWLGMIPVHWKISRLKNYVRMRYGDALASDIRENGDIPVYGSNGPVGTHAHPNTCAPAIIVGRKGSYGKIVWAENGGFVIDTAYAIDNAETSQNIRWLYYVLQILGLDSLSQDTGVPGLSRDKAYQLKITIPPIYEQGAIANFLDRETARIDKLIAEKQTFIKLLKEKRQSLISHVVTKGLNPNVKMKDSGIEWIGDVPEHWITCRLKQISNFITSGPRGWSDLIEDNGDSLFLQSGDLNNNLGLELAKAKRVSPPEGAEGIRTKLLNGDVVVCITGANTGRVALAQSLNETVYINQHLSLIRPISEKIRSKYLAYFLSSEAGSKYYAITQYGLKEGLSLKNISETPVAFPQLEEQQLLEDRLDREMEKFNLLIDATLQSVDLLKEHRTALITAAVTGKIDVRNQ